VSLASVARPGRSATGSTCVGTVVTSRLPVLFTLVGGYTYKPGHLPGEVAIAEAPDWLTDMVVSSNSQSVIPVEEGELAASGNGWCSPGRTTRMRRSSPRHGPLQSDAPSRL
jgi:hypothetical protein